MALLEGEKVLVLPINKKVSATVCLDIDFEASEPRPRLGADVAVQLEAPEDDGMEDPPAILALLPVAHAPPVLRHFQPLGIVFLSNHVDSDESWCGMIPSQLGLI